MEQDKNKRLDELFKQARTEPSKVSYEETKGQFLKNIGNLNKVGTGGKLSKFFNLKNWIIMITTISTLTLGIVMLMNNSTKQAHNNIKHAEVKSEFISDSMLIVQKQEKNSSNTTIKQVVKGDLKKDSPESGKTVSETQPVQNEQKTTVNNNNKSFPKKSKSVKDDGSFQFPKLTMQEIKENNKRKERYFKMYVKLEPFGYLPIPKGEMPIDNKTVSIGSFLMKQTEVTNVEYKTFLFDLLIQNRKDEFLIAKPDQSQWKTSVKGAYGEELEKIYFSDQLFENYPVVNISREGAEMYCKWLSDGINNAQQKKLKGKKASVQLPTNEEWSYAASKGGKDSYAWSGMATRQNDLGCFLANYKYVPELDMVTITGCVVKYPKAQTTSGLLLGENSFTVKVNSYNPNGFNLYCMSGNVAEMVSYADKTVGAKGGSWNTTGEFLKINAPDQYKGITSPNVNIGFRPMINFILDENSRLTMIDNPPGTVKVEDHLYMDEYEVTNFNWKEYLTWQTKTYGKTSNEYINALPDTLVWRNKESFNESYTQYYYNHPAYNDYPVVGISYEQAVDYCKWRTERVKELFVLKESTDNKNVYPSNFEYRLPTKEEWEKAANIVYSEKTQQQLNTKYKGQLLANLKRNTEENVVVAGNIADNADITAPVKSYWSNAAGCYNLIGNVAEMTNVKGIAKGGSWINNPNDVTIEKDLPYTIPTSWLGFRCVFEILE